MDVGNAQLACRQLGSFNVTAVQGVLDHPNAMTDPNETIADRIAQRCKELGISEEAAEKRAGISKGWVSAIRSKRTQSPRADRAALMARVLGVNTDWLVTGEGDPRARPSQDETDLLAAYREMTPEEREAVLRILRRPGTDRAG